MTSETERRIQAFEYRCLLSAGACEECAGYCTQRTEPMSRCGQRLQMRRNTRPSTGNHKEQEVIMVWPCQLFNRIGKVIHAGFGGGGEGEEDRELPGWIV